MHIMTEQQRADQTQQSREQHDRAGNVEPCAGTPRHRRHDPPGRGHDDQAERQVDEKHRAPAQPGQIRRHQDTAEQKAGRAGKAKHHAVNAKGPAARRIGKQQMKGGEHLRHHQRRGRTLRQPREDQFGSGLCQPAPQRRQREAEYAGQKYIPGAVDIAEPAAGNHQRGIGNQIDRDHRLDLGRTRV